jgi:RNA polymerase sigma factor (sigma-70 family)
VTSPIDDWLRVANRFPLLTPAEELILARQVQEWLQHPAPVPRPVERRGQRAKRRMIEANLRLVYNGWKKFGTHINIEPVVLLQEGAIGLDHAVMKFDPAKGYKFSTYAYNWIRQAMWAVGGRGDGAIRLPSDNRQLRSRLEKGEQLKPGERDRLRAAELARVTFSLDSPTGGQDDDSRCLLDEIEAPTGCGLDAIDSSDAAARLHRCMARLEDQERQVASALWGLADGVERTHHQAGQLLGMKRSQVAAIAERVQERLRELILDTSQPVAVLPIQPERFDVVEQLILPLQILDCCEAAIMKAARIRRRRQRDQNKYFLQMELILAIGL